MHSYNSHYFTGWHFKNTYCLGWFSTIRWERISKVKELCFCFFNTALENNRFNKDIKDIFKNLWINLLHFFGEQHTSACIFILHKPAKNLSNHHLKRLLEWLKVKEIQGSKTYLFHLIVWIQCSLSLYSKYSWHHVGVVVDCHLKT